MNRFTLVVIAFLFVHIIRAQYTISPSAIKWYDIQQAFELNKKELRPILIDVYTESSSWCRLMMKSTFAKKGIADFINNNFYPVRFNAESLDTVEYQGRKYFNRRIGRKPTHDLASILLEGKLSYPSIVFIDRAGKKTVVPGYKEPKDIEPVLVYQVENLSKYISLDEFTANFMFTFPVAFEKDHSIFKISSIIRPDTLGTPNWLKPEKINIQNKKKRKPTVLFFYTDGCISCKVMDKTTFRNQEINALIHKDFNLVKINANSQETINFFGKQYGSNAASDPHQLAQALLQDDFQMPALLFFDKSGMLISKLNGYITVQNLKALIQFFLEKKYQNISYNEYLKTLNNGSKNIMN